MQLERSDRTLTGGHSTGSLFGRLTITESPSQKLRASIWRSLVSECRFRNMRIAARRPALSARVIVNVGACLDYLAGTRALTRWLGRIGFEWLFRLLRDPRRLWHRYLVEPILLAIAIAKFHRGRRG